MMRPKVRRAIEIAIYKYDIWSTGASFGCHILPHNGHLILVEVGRGNNGIQKIWRAFLTAI
jgi:hypothetical protein